MTQLEMVSQHIEIEAKFRKAINILITCGVTAKDHFSSFSTTTTKASFIKKSKLKSTLKSLNFDFEKYRKLLDL